MPVTTPDIKVANVKRLGGTVELVGESYQEAQAHALSVSGWVAAVEGWLVKGPLRCWIQDEVGGPSHRLALLLTCTPSLLHHPTARRH